MGMNVFGYWKRELLVQCIIWSEVKRYYYSNHTMFLVSTCMHLTVLDIFGLSVHAPIRKILEGCSKFM